MSQPDSEVTQLQALEACWPYGGPVDPWCPVTVDCMTIVARPKEVR